MAQSVYQMPVICEDFCVTNCQVENVPLLQQKTKPALNEY